MTIQSITDATHCVVELLSDYFGGHVGRREMLLDPILYGYFQGRFGHMERQHYIHMYGSHIPQRIDLRFGTDRPVVLEFAVRPPSGGGTLYGSQNRSELRKLCRAENATMRVLLLIDLSRKPHRVDNLRRSYLSQNGGPGNFERRSVRVIYVSNEIQYNFLWRP
jgi:hypothetical protein